MRAPPPGPPALVTPKKDAKLQLLFQGKSQWQMGSSLRSAHSVSPWNGRNCCSALREERERVSRATHSRAFFTMRTCTCDHSGSFRQLCLQTVCVCLIHITSHHIAICLPLSAAVVDFRTQARLCADSSFPLKVVIHRQCLVTFAPVHETLNTNDLMTHTGTHLNDESTDKGN